MGRLRIGLATVVIVSALLAAPVAAEPPSVDSPAALKAAARARLAEVAPEFALARIDLYRVVGEFALVRVIPPPEVADPTLVLLQRRDDRWQAIGGPSTVFPDRASRANAPDRLFDVVTPFIGPLADQTIAAGTMPLLTHRSPLYSFSYPANAGVVVAGPTVSLVGPIVVGGAVPRAAYEIAIVVISPTVTISLDEWAFSRVRATVAMRAREGVTWPEPEFFVTSPLTDFYGISGVVLAQVDWAATDAIVRELYLAPVGGSVIVHLRIRVPTDDDPHAQEAFRALTILVRTLSFATVAAAPTVALAPPPRFTDSSAPITVTAGQRFQLAIAANPASGFLWELAEPLNPEALSLLSVDFAAPPGGFRPDRDGLSIWTFAAIAPAEVALTLHSIRPWNRALPPAAVVTYTIRIVEPPAPAAPESSE